MSHPPPNPPPRAPATGRERPWLRGLAVAAAVAGLAGAAVLEGVWTKRWGASAELQAATARLGGVPKAFGGWAGEDVPLDDKLVRVAEATGYVQRNYRHGKNGGEVTVLLLCGPGGPIGAHTPEYCYAGNGYAMAGEPQKKAVPVPGGAASYWSARFAKPGSADPPLRVCWMWGTGGDWEAAANARLGLQPVLYKLYVVRAEPGGPPPADRDPVHAFLTDFLPEVKRALAPPAG